MVDIPVWKERKRQKRAKQRRCVSQSSSPSLRLQIEKCQLLHSSLKEVQIELHAFKGRGVGGRKIITHIVLLPPHGDLFFLCFIFLVEKEMVARWAEGVWQELCERMKF